MACLWDVRGAFSYTVIPAPAFRDNLNHKRKLRGKCWTRVRTKFGWDCASARKMSPALPIPFAMSFRTLFRSHHFFNRHSDAKSGRIQ